jgi:hypothetical protein
MEIGRRKHRYLAAFGHHAGADEFGPMWNPRRTGNATDPIM